MPNKNNSDEFYYSFWTLQQTSTRLSIWNTRQAWVQGCACRKRVNWETR